MRISRIYVESELVEGRHIAFDQDRSHYLRHVLRLKPGATIVLFNGCDGKDYRGKLTLSGKQLGAAIESSTFQDNESPLQCSLLQALGRSDHVDWLIQKATELGVQRIILFSAERTQYPPKPDQLAKKQRHWRNIAISACEQSGRARLPTVSCYPSLTQAIEQDEAKLRLLLHFDGPPLIGHLHNQPGSLSILTGAEGGLSTQEIEVAKTHGYHAAAIGPRVLRFETAAITALALAQAQAGDLSARDFAQTKSEDAFESAVNRS